MKQLNVSIFIAGILILSLSSCKKSDQSPPPTTTTANKFSEINAPASFSWSTSNKINFSFKGLAAEDYQSVLKVIDSDGTILIQKLQKANENYKVILEIPAHYKTLTVSFGSILEEIDCTTGSVEIAVN